MFTKFISTDNITINNVIKTKLIVTRRTEILCSVNFPTISVSTLRYEFIKTYDRITNHSGMNAKLMVECPIILDRRIKFVEQLVEAYK